jgi:hypothetical protein
MTKGRTSLWRLFVSALPANITVLIGTFVFSTITGNWLVFGSSLCLVWFILILRRFSFDHQGHDPANWTRRELLDAYRNLLLDLDAEQSNVRVLRDSLNTRQERIRDADLRDEVLIKVRNTLVTYDATRDARIAIESLRSDLRSFTSHDEYR